jgi:hypothetical protein
MVSLTSSMAAEWSAFLPFLLFFFLAAFATFFALAAAFFFAVASLLRASSLAFASFLCYNALSLF